MNITQAKIQLDVYNRGVQERFEKVADDVPVKTTWSIDLDIVGGVLSLPITSSQYSAFKQIAVGSPCRLRAVMLNSGTRRFFREVELEPLPPSAPLNTVGHLRGNFSGYVDQYEKKDEIFRSLVLQGFGLQLQLRDESAIQQFNQLQNKSCFRVEASFTFDTRWRQGASGKYQTLDPQLQDVVLSDLPAGGPTTEGRRREREVREQQKE